MAVVDTDIHVAFPADSSIGIVVNVTDNSWLRPPLRRDAQMVFGPPSLTVEFVREKPTVIPGLRTTNMENIIPLLVYYYVAVIINTYYYTLSLSQTHGK